MTLTLIFILPLRLESCVQLFLPCFVVCLFQDYYSRKQEILRLLFSYLFVPVPHRHGDFYEYFCSKQRELFIGLQQAAVWRDVVE